MADTISTDQLRSWLDNADQAYDWLVSLGMRETAGRHENLLAIAQTSITLDLLACLVTQLQEKLRACSDPDMALNNLERFIRASRNPLSLGSLLERDEEAMDVLVQIFSTSQRQSDLLIQEPEAFDLLRLTSGQPVARHVLVEEFQSEIATSKGHLDTAMILSQFKQRETLRIAYGDLIGGQRLSTVAQQISYLADAICEGALSAAAQHLQPSLGTPRRGNGQPASFVVLALGKLGGVELNYSSDIDLIFLYDEVGRTDGAKSVSNEEYFRRLAKLFVKLLTEPHAMGTVYRVDLRLRPQGRQGPMVNSEAAALQYYDVMGRTWERQAFVKARPVAGDLDFGEQFLKQLQPWVYRRYLSNADITGIKALKRRIEKRAIREGADRRDVKKGRGGIRDIEFVIQFLQLLNGGDLPEIRTGNTLAAINGLEQAGCLKFEERNQLEQNYVFLRNVEHRLQIMFDLQTHLLPEDEHELHKLAIRMRFADSERASALDEFKQAYLDATEKNRKVLDRLLHDAFGDDDSTEPEVDLVLEPEPPDQIIDSVMGAHGFRNTHSAYDHLMSLSVEKVPFLSTRRCRHFLAAIAPKLLACIARTPDPDATLIDLSHISDSLGGKGVLWEMMSVNQPSMELYVHLCAACPYLSGILTSHPGMIDELMDSLLLDRLPTSAQLQEQLTELCRGAEDIEPILHGFKNSQHLTVGVRDILGKEDIRNTTATLSDVAEVCVQQIVLREYDRLIHKYGIPQRPADQSADDDSSHHRPGQTGTDVGLPHKDGCELVILGMGKLGGREPNYHSDLDIIFLFEADGITRQPARSRRTETTTNQHFFSELGQRVIRFVNRMGPLGRLYEMDARLRPSGRSGALAVSLDEFVRYFADGRGELWERQALCKARPVFGSSRARQLVMREVRNAIVQPGWAGDDAASIRHMRQRLEETASKQNLKRGPGGTVDVEFAVQMLQLRFAAEHPDVLVPGTLAAIEALQAKSLLAQEDADSLAESYRFLRSIEARLRLMDTTARHDLPQEAGELAKLAYLLGMPSNEALVEQCQHYTDENRRRFDRLFSTTMA